MAINYHCFNLSRRNTCEHCDKKGDLTIDEPGDYVCPNNPEEPLKEMGSTGGTIIPLEKMSTEAIRKDRTHRRKEHFQKEVMPYLPKEDQRSFFRKGYKNK